MVVNDFDVVARLSDHQANLLASRVTHFGALLALPTPRILSALLGSSFEPMRARWIARWADRLGGGNGPLPAIDLDADPANLGAILRRLEATGARHLFILGSRDQPGFARQLLCRWPYALNLSGLVTGTTDLPRHLSSFLHDDAAPVRVLDGGVARILPGATVPADVRLLLAAVDAGEDPQVVVDRLAQTGREVRAYARDPERLAGAGHGFLPPEALFTSPRGNRLRDTWRSYWAALGLEAFLREAALGLDSVLDARLAEPRPPVVPTSAARVFVVTGIDGAGKSSHSAALRDALVAAGSAVSVVKIYRHDPFLALADELSERTRHGAPLANFRVSRIVKLIDSLRIYRDQVRTALSRSDAVVFDRYTETHRAAAASQLGWNLSHHPSLTVFPQPDRVFWLRLDPREALRRISARGGRLSADEHLTGLDGYSQAFASLAVSPTDVILDAAAPWEVNADRIAREAGVSAVATSPHTPADLARQAPTRRSCLPVTAGHGDGEEVLGSDITSLVLMLREELGAEADGIPVGFWIEAYATQLVLDARTTTASSAVVSLWPGALRRMAAFVDLLVLEEVERLLEPLVTVRAWRPIVASSSATPWEMLSRSPTAQERLNEEYNDALAVVASQCGWRRPR